MCRGPVSFSARMTKGVGRLKQHVREPMHGSAYSLILGSAMSSVLGLLFWVIAARRFDAEVVGTATSTIAAMGLLANLATLGLRGGLVRFLPVAGTGAIKLVLRSYLICGLAASAVAIIFIFGQPLWASELELLRQSPMGSAAFVVATAACVITVLQEYVLAGLHRATWVPLACVAYSGLKIIILFFAIAASPWSIFVAYSAPAVVTSILVNYLLVRSISQSGRQKSDVSPPSIVGLARYAAGDHAAFMLWLATIGLLPLLVLAQAGAGASAYYYLSFMAGYTLYLVTASIGNALVAEASRDLRRLEELARRAFRNSLLLVVPAAGFGVCAAPVVLRVLGEDYVSEATGLLRLILLSAIPQVIVGVATSMFRVQRRIGRIVMVYAALGVLIFAGSAIALPTVGLIGVGWAWLLAETMVAAALLSTQMTFLWAGPVGDFLVNYGSAARRTLRERYRLQKLRRTMRLLARRAGTNAREYTLLRSENATLVSATVIKDQQVVVKMDCTCTGDSSVTRHARILEKLAVEPGAIPVLNLVPSLLAHGNLDGRAYLIENRLPGSPLSHVGDADQGVPAVTADVARALDRLHRGTARRIGMNEGLLERLVREPISAICSTRHAERHFASLTVLGDILLDALSGLEVTVSWTHGDLWLGNVLAGPDTRISGIVDWEDARPDGLPDVDLAHLWLTAQNGEISARLLAALRKPEDGFDRWLEEHGLPRRNLHLRTPVVLVLAWLGHVHAAVRRSPPNGPGRVWWIRTVDPVLPEVATLMNAAFIAGDAP